jgi:large subunit ribosomal protein L11
MSVQTDYAVLTLNIKGGQAKAEDLSKAAGYGFSPDELSAKINEKTQLLKGVDIKVVVHLYPKARRFFIEVQPPSTTVLLLKKAGASEPSGDPAHKKVGDIKMKDVIEVAISKKHELNTTDLKKAVKTILGSARSIGLTVEGLDPKEVTAKLERGEYDSLLREYENIWSKF